MGWANCCGTSIYCRSYHGRRHSLIANGSMGAPDLALVRYFPTHPTIGYVIDTAIYYLAFAIALGILAEISFTLRKLLNQTEGEGR